MHVEAYRGDREYLSDQLRLLHNVVVDDLIEYGFIPEFVGRLPVIAVLDELTDKELKTILLDSEHALIKEYKALFAIDGIDLEFSEEAVNAIIKATRERNTGARVLRSIIEKVLTPVVFENGKPISQDKTRITLDAKAVEDALK